MTEKSVHLGKSDAQPQNRDWLRIMAKQHEAERNQPERAPDTEDAAHENLSMTYLDPDDLDASWEALQRLTRGDETNEPS